MSHFASTSAALLILAGAAAAPAAGARDAIPDFSPTPGVAWIAWGPEFTPVAGEPAPVRSDPAHPWVPNAVEYFFGPPKGQGTQTNSPIADLSNPILKPATRAALAELKTEILAGKTLDNPEASCRPAGVPAFLLHPVTANFFVQGPKEVLLISQGDHMVRHIHLNVPHDPQFQPSWFGDSVGHYEGDTLVVDTIGISTKAYVDRFRTPHSAKLHVIERFHMIDGGKTLEVDLHIEDADAFTTPWNAVQHFARVDRGSLQEQSCAENNANYFRRDVDPMPVAERPDF
jgi:hypothetical protein